MRSSSSSVVASLGLAKFSAVDHGPFPLAETDCVAGGRGLELGNVALRKTLGRTPWFPITISYKRLFARTAKAGDGGSEPVFYGSFWHTASNRCGAKVRTRSERSGHAESVGSGLIRRK